MDNTKDKGVGLSDEAIQEFKRIYKEEYGEDISFGRHGVVK